ncbi:MAG: response regulator receiver domain protein (CheY-like) [Rhodocyclaceae bacterium]|nr:response regulator receiver domain protein (CheY-like) [Rhodocyclaceae bacterium]
MQPITVAILDSDQVKRTACEYLLRYEEDIQVVAQVATLKEVTATVLGLQPQVLLCRFSLAAVESFALLRSLRSECPAPAVLLLTDRSIQDDQIMQGLNMGARGHLSYDSISSQLAKAIRSISEGEAWIPRQMLGRLLERATRAA